MAKTRMGTYRADAELLVAVAAKAAGRGETVTAVIERAFQAYIQDGAPAEPVYTPLERAAREVPPTTPSAGPLPGRVREPDLDCRHPVGMRIGDMCGKCHRVVRKR
jgi:hypothetical protein